MTYNKDTFELQLNILLGMAIFELDNHMCKLYLNEQYLTTQ